MQETDRQPWQPAKILTSSNARNAALNERTAKNYPCKLATLTKNCLGIDIFSFLNQDLDFKYDHKSPESLFQLLHREVGHKLLIA